MTQSVEEVPASAVTINTKGPQAPGEHEIKLALSVSKTTLTRQLEAERKSLDKQLGTVNAEFRATGIAFGAQSASFGELLLLKDPGISRLRRAVNAIIDGTYTDNMEFVSDLDVGRHSEDRDKLIVAFHLRLRVYEPDEDSSDDGTRSFSMVVPVPDELRALVTKHWDEEDRRTALYVQIDANKEKTSRIKDSVQDVRAQLEIKQLQTMKRGPEFLQAVVAAVSAQVDGQTVDLLEAATATSE